MPRRVTTVAALLLIAGCADDPTGTLLDSLTGEFAYSETVSTSLSATCVSTGTMKLNESGTGLTGTVASRGTCTNSNGSWSVGSNAELSGTVDRDGDAVRVAFSLGGCPHQGTGTVVGGRLRLSGTLSCSVNGILLQGSWSAER